MIQGVSGGFSKSQGCSRGLKDTSRGLKGLQGCSSRSQGCFKGLLRAPEALRTFQGGPRGMFRILYLEAWLVVFAFRFCYEIFSTKLNIEKPEEICKTFSYIENRVE